jgi:hypothetical protein
MLFQAQLNKVLKSTIIVIESRRFRILHIFFVTYGRVSLVPLHDKLVLELGALALSFPSE